MTSHTSSTGEEHEQAMLVRVHEQPNDSPCVANASSSSSGRSSPPCDRSFLCPVDGCNRRFHRNFTLREHLKTHTGEKPFQCQVKWCGKRFKTSGNMSRHRRLHLQKQFQCPAEGCLRIFTKQEKLALHYRIHMGSNAFPCTVPGCPKAFSTSGNLTRHVRRHHPGIKCTGSPSSGCAKLSSEQCISVAIAHTRATAIGGTSLPCHGEQSWPPLTSSRCVDTTPVSDQELLELLQCLFWDPSPPATTAPWLATTVAAPRQQHSLSSQQYGQCWL